MTNQTIDNSADEQFGNVILWQYDKAINLCSFINELKSFFNSTTKNIWDTMLSEINIDTADDYGLSIIGTLIGCPRPDEITTELYRKIIKARFTLMMSNFSVPDINLYLKTIFGDGEGAITVVDNGAFSPDGGWSEWECDPEMVYGQDVIVVWKDEEWEFRVAGNFYHTGSSDPDANNLDFLFEDSIHITATRHRIEYSPMTLGWNYDPDEMGVDERVLTEDYPELVFNYPAGVFDGSAITHHVFALEGQQPVESTDPLVGGLDDSNFIYTEDETKYIPENERIVS